VPDRVLDFHARRGDFSGWPAKPTKITSGLAVWTVEHDLVAGERKFRQEPRAWCRLAATSKPSAHRHAVDARREFDRGYGGERQRDRVRPVQA
jgi:hypothetical protein